MADVPCGTYVRTVLIEAQRPRPAEIGIALGVHHPGDSGCEHRRNMTESRTNVGDSVVVGGRDWGDGIGQECFRSPVPPRATHGGANLRGALTRGVRRGVLVKPPPADFLTLRDTRTVLLRPLAADDAPLLAQLFLRLSEMSRFRRFLGPRKRFPLHELTAYADIDHRQREAIAALAFPSADLVGVAQFWRDESDETVAEVALTVTDEFQGAGLGTALLDRLVQRARCEGITRFRAQVHESNRRALNMGRRIGPRVAMAFRSPGVIEAEFDLSGDGVVRRHTCADAGAPTRDETGIPGMPWNVLEVYQSLAYSAPEVRETLAEIGIHGFWTSILASRAAALGPVSVPSAAAAFYDLAPRLVADTLSDLWERTNPERVLAARLAGTDAALRRILGDMTHDAAAVEVAALARMAVERCPTGGRLLFAAHRSLPWPEESHLALWHAALLLHEYREAARVSNLISAGLDGCEAQVMAVALGLGPRSAFQPTQGWTDDEWGAAEVSLMRHGLLQDSGAITSEGLALHEAVEARTVQLTLVPYRELGEGVSARLTALVTPLADLVEAADGSPTPAPRDAHDLKTQEDPSAGVVGRQGIHD